jgi:charged multivesicular body protein 1
MLEKGNIEGAKIFSQNVIRKKSESLNFLKMSARVDAAASKLKEGEF